MALLKVEAAYAWTRAAAPEPDAVDRRLAARFACFVERMLVQHHLRFVEDAVLPRITRAAYELVERHRAQGDTLVLTTATNRVITEPTARHLGFAHLIATEVELGDNGCFSGRPSG